MGLKFFFIRTIFFLISFLSLKDILSQTVISGVVKNKNGFAVSFATIKLKQDSIGPQSIAYAIASADGYFSLKCPATVKKGFIEISAVGFHPLYIYLSKIEGAEEKLYPVLEEDAKPLPEIYLKADLPIQVSGDTVSFKVDAFKFGDESNVVKLLSKMPGFTILENGKLAFNGEPIAKVLIDNDDLTGNSYEELIKNLSTSGIQKIQVFRNYKDPENITSQILNSNSQVLNLKYGEKFKGKVLGNVQLSVGVPLRYYDERSQLVSLIPKAKAIGIFGLNSVGELYNNNNATTISSGNDIQEISDISLLTNKSLAEIKDITFQLLQQSPIRKNNSGQGMVNFYFHPDKKLIIKSSTVFFKDKYVQNALINNIIYTPLQQIIQSQNKGILKNVTSFQQSLSINYLVDKKNQIGAVVKLYRESANGFGSGLLNNEPYDERSKGKNNQLSWKVTYNHIFSAGSIFTFIVLAKKNKLPENYIFNPSYYDTLFLPFDIYRYNEQNEHQKFSQLFTLMSYLKRFHKSSLNLNLTAGVTTSSLLNNLYVYNDPENKIMINKNLTNNLNLIEKQIKLNIQKFFDFDQVFSFTLGTELEFRKQEINNRENNLVLETLNKFSMLPLVSGYWNLNKQKRISFTYRFQNSTPFLKYLSPGFILSDNTSLYKGFDSLQIQSAPLFQITFSHLDILRKGILFFAGFNVTRTPLFLLADQHPSYHYTFLQYKSTTAKPPITSLIFRIDKIFLSKSSKISGYINYSRGTNYSLVHSQKLETIFNQVKTGLNGNMTVKKFSLNAGVVYSRTNQKRTSLDKSISSTRNLKLNTESSMKIGERIFLNLTILKNWLFIPGQSALHTIQIDSKLLIQSKNEKIDWGINGSNLTNQKTFSYYQITSYQSSYAEYRLLPVQILFFLNYKI